jgi:cell division protein ZapC
LILRDSAQWFWCYNPEQKQLAIDTGDGEPLVLPYKPQQLVNIGFSQQGFDVEDANAYQQVLEFLQSYHQNALPVEPHKAALCALGFCRFGCPQMPQSWHFQKSDLEQWPQQRQLCELNSGFDQGLFLILEMDDEFASCMLLSKRMQVSAIKTLRQFQVMKVLNNRLLPATIDLATAAQKQWNTKLA